MTLAETFAKARGSRPAGLQDDQTVRVWRNERLLGDFRVAAFNWDLWCDYAVVDHLPNQVPKCTSWLGHKFEGRYSKSPASGHGKINLGWADAEAVALVLDGYRTVTYVCDICERCGFVVERKTAEKSTEPTS